MNENVEIQIKLLTDQFTKGMKGVGNTPQLSDLEKSIMKKMGFKSEAEYVKYKDMY